MLDEKDLQAIRGVVKEEVQTEVRASERRIIHAVGEMLSE